MSLFEELKRRNVFRVGIAYAISAWLLIQIADVMIDNIGAPDWVFRTLLLVLAVGFPISIILAWAFELTPEGIRREKDVDRDSSITRHTGRKLELITLAAAGLVLVLFVVGQLTDDPPAPGQGEPPFTAGDSNDETGDRVQAGPNQAVERGSATAERVDRGAAEPGVAVLPFENLSANEDNAFFAGGVHEDVLTHISRISDLKVISRTSMLRIADQALAIPEIGRQLGVTHVLEGSVRRAGDQVRVSVQLIDAAADRQLWSESYDRRLDDIFAIQSEIAESIATQLATELSPEERARIEQVPTRNLQAYDLYLEAREMRRVWRGAEGFDDMRMLLEEAVAIDPEFLEAKVLLATAYGRLSWAGADPDGLYREQATRLTDEIMTAYPESTQAALARADFRYLIMRDYDQALRDYLALLKNDPNNIELLKSAAGSLKRLNRFSEGLVLIDRALALDPENPSNLVERSFHLFGLKRFEEAIKLLESTYARFPEDESVKSSLGEFKLIVFGDLDAWRSLNPNRIGTADGVDFGETHLLGDGFQRRLALDEVGADFLLEGLEKARMEGNNWRDIMIEVAAAETLNLAGREADSRARAAIALALLERRVAEGKGDASNSPRYLTSLMAYTACLANEPEKAAIYLGLAENLEVDDISTTAYSEFERMKSLAECGSIDEAWTIAEELDLLYAGVQQHMLTYDPIFAHYFSGLPAFQEVISTDS